MITLTVPGTDPYDVSVGRGTFAGIPELVGPNLRCLFSPVNFEPVWRRTTRYYLPRFRMATTQSASKLRRSVGKFWVQQTSPDPTRLLDSVAAPLLIWQVLLRQPGCAG